MLSRRKKCPKCGRHDVIPIQYGYPGPEMIAEAERGEIELGGCCVTDRDPTLKCKACGEAFGRPSPRARRGRPQPSKRALLLGPR